MNGPAYLLALKHAGLDLEKAQAGQQAVINPEQ